MSEPIIVNSTESLQSAFGWLRNAFMSHKYLRITVKPGKARTISQNDISHAWYEQLAKELREDNALGWKCYSKLICGVPILRAEEEEFRSFYDASIKKLTYEQKLEAMKFVPITSIMTTPQFTQYLDGVKTHFFEKYRVILENPNAA